MVWLNKTVRFCLPAGLFVVFVLTSAPVLADEIDTDIPEMHIMPDGTLSWEQPDSSGTFGYNGYCGETAAANIISMLRFPTSPDVVKDTCQDSTPGTLPSTIADYLTTEMGVQWSIYNLRAYYAFRDLKTALDHGTLIAENGNSPVAVLIKIKGKKAYHWITVVDIDDNDNVIYNEYGKQEIISKKDFMVLWSFHGITSIWRSTLRRVGVVPFTMVSQNHTQPELNLVSR